MPPRPPSHTTTPSPSPLPPLTSSPGIPSHPSSHPPCQGHGVRILMQQSLCMPCTSTSMLTGTPQIPPPSAKISYAHARTQATAHARTHARACTRTHRHAHTRTRTHPGQSLVELVVLVLGHVCGGSEPDGFVVVEHVPLPHLLLHLLRRCLVFIWPQSSR